jgi:nitroreductase
VGPGRHAPGPRRGRAAGYAEDDKGWTDRDEDRWPVPYWYVDTGMAAENLLLAVVDEGLGALFFGIPRPLWDVFRFTFGVPATWDPVGAVALGHPGDPAAEPRSSGHTRPRRTLDEVVHRGRW